MSGPASRRPRRLDDPTPPRAREPHPPRRPTPQQLLERAHVSGAADALDRLAVTRAVRAVAAGEPTALFGLEPFVGTGVAEVSAAAAATFGWASGQVESTIAAGATLDAMAAALDQIASVARARGRLALATARPASMLPLLQAVAGAAARAGATVLDGDATDSFRADGRARRRVWWHGGVAVVTDGLSLIPVAGTQAASEWLFCISRPDLVVAGHGFAGLALRSGVPTIAFCDVDSPVFALAAARRLPCLVVPLHDTCPPAAYTPLVELVVARFAPGV